MKMFEGLYHRRMTHQSKLVHKIIGIDITNKNKCQVILHQNGLNNFYSRSV